MVHFKEENLEAGLKFEPASGFQLLPEEKLEFAFENTEITLAENKIRLL